MCGCSKPRDDLPLAQEAREQCFAVHAALDELERGALLELAIGALDQQHDSHAAAAEFANHAPRTDARAVDNVDVRRLRTRPLVGQFHLHGDDIVFERGLSLVGGEQR